jgi:beta-glucosidase-like glycosyl hydrolase
MARRKLFTRILSAVVAIALYVGVIPSVSFAAEKATFKADYASLAAEQKASNDFNIELAKESFVLMKNTAGALPLPAGAKLSVYGVRSDEIIMGGSGSGGGSNGATEFVSVKKSLEDSGFALNPLLVDFYAKPEHNSSAEIVDQELKAIDASGYSDAALIVFSRTGSEFADAAMYNVLGHSDPTDHTYSFTDAEKALIDYVGSKFSKVVVVINSAHPMELGPVAWNSKISSILWMGHPGTTGAAALGPILKGDVNPSGHTVDVWAANFAADPTYANYMGNIQAQTVIAGEVKVDAVKFPKPGVEISFDMILASGDFSLFDLMGQNFIDENGDGALQETERTPWPSEYVVDENKDGKWDENEMAPVRMISGKSVIDENRDGVWQQTELILAPAGTAGMGNLSEEFLEYSRFRDKDGNMIEIDGPSAGANYIASLDYEEGIYMGYRWYETADAEGYFASKGGYYNQSSGVIYPFGYGLSYTSFKQEIKSAPSKLDKDGDIKIVVTVTNTGSAAGKDVVQLYSTPTYIKGQIEKASKNLITFAKTPVINPGASVDVELTFKTQDLASFDYNDANKNGHKGYEIDAGQITFTLGKNSHEVYASKSYSFPAINYDTDSDTGAASVPLFSGDGSWDGTRSDNDYYETSHADWMSGDGKSGWTELSRADFAGTFPEPPTAKELTLSDDALKIVLSQIYYTSFNDLPTDPWYKSKDGIPADWTQASTAAGSATSLYSMSGLAYDDPAWVPFLNQLTYDELVAFISSNSFSTPANARIGKVQTTDSDGPAQLSSGTFWVSEANVASTYNLDLVEKQGVFIGNESLLQGVQGWYGPGLNIHRNPAAGRNFEYYSQDGVQGGLIAASVIKGALSKGIVTYMKHLFLNDQETSRYTAATFVNEQALREIYARPWEYAIKAGANASMAAFNRVGLLETTANYNLYTRLLEDEWGFHASTVSDMFGWGYNPGTSGDMAARTAITPLGTWNNTFGRNIEGVWDPAKKTVVVTFTGKITDGTDWTYANGKWSSAAYNDRPADQGGNTADIQAVNRGYSKAFKDATTMKNGSVPYAVGDTLDSYTQWHAVRTAAHKLLYVHANANTTQNGVTSNPLQSAKFSATQGQAASFSAAATPAGHTAVYSAPATLAVPDPNAAAPAFGAPPTINVPNPVPPGLTVNADGTISGTPTAAGEYVFTINVMIDGWIDYAQEYTITVS